MGISPERMEDKGKMKNRRMTGKNWKHSRSILLLLVGLFVCGLCLIHGSVAEKASFHLPIIEADETSSSGLKATWSCVYFGQYPSVEIVGDAWDAVDEYALQPGDVCRDEALYAELSAADWKDNMTERNGVSYLRVGLNKAPGVDIREQHYNWSYEQPWHYFEITPIRWRVLDVRENQALLLADRLLDCVPFHRTDEEITWGESTLRDWLNGYGEYAGAGFIDRAFSGTEQDAILSTNCRNRANQDYGTDSGADTIDRVFILSNEEVFEGENAQRYGFHAGRDYDDPAKRFTSTLYAKCMGTWWSPVDEYAGNSFWFMRTSGYTARSVTYVCDFGYIYSRGTLITCADAGILPAIWVDLDRADLSDAGERTSLDILHLSKQDEPGETPVALQNPTVIRDASQPGGAYTIWNAIAFGTYPQEEVRETEDAAVLARLKAFGDSREEVTLDDIRYIRLEDRWFRSSPIIWRVLEVSGGTALLMSDRGLDCVSYNDEYQDVFWENSDVRQWLNESFLKTAFTEEDIRSIIVSSVPNDINYYFGTACGSGTHDAVFLLSEGEVFSSAKAEAYGFRPSDGIPDPGRKIKPTAYAAARGAWQSQKKETPGRGFWILRTNGYTRDNIVYVGEKGYLYNRGIPVTCADAIIVPAIRINLGAAAYSRVEDISFFTE